ncbi:hypothetical protein ALO36_104319 [Pseudomonas syringae pv. tomato]|nr:hypothetical protein ALO36_104319 [Pseudomonas syringae pv. tomato]
MQRTMKRGRRASPAAGQHFKVLACEPCVSRRGIYTTLSLQLQKRALQGLQGGAGRRDLSLDRKGFHGLFLRCPFAALRCCQLRLLLGELLLSIFNLLLYFLDRIIEGRLARTANAATTTCCTSLAAFGGSLIRAFLCLSGGRRSSSRLGCFGVGRLDRDRQRAGVAVQCRSIDGSHDGLLGF